MLHVVALVGHSRLSARFHAAPGELMAAAFRTIFWSSAFGLTSWEASRSKLNVEDDANWVTANQPYTVRRTPQPPV